MYLLYPHLRKYYLYVIPAVIGVFAKETVLVLIILLFFYNLLFERKLSVGDLFKGKNFKIVLNTVWILLPVFLAVAAVQYYTLSAITHIPGITNPAGYYWLTQTYVWLHYFISFFFPLNLSADTDWAVILNVFDIRVLGGIAFLIVFIVAIFKTSAKPETKPVAFGLIWFAASLLPTSLAPFAEVTNDHRMFFAFVGLSLSIVTWIGLWLKKREKQIAINTRYQTLIFSAALVILALNAYGVHQRNSVWRTEESLWYDVTVKSPNNGRGLMNYGLSQMAKGNFNTALDYYERALPMLPTYSTLYINIGIAKGAKGLHTEAEQNFKMGIFFAPNAFDPYVYYARYLKENKKYEEAKVMAEKALQLNPQSILTLQILMEIYNNLSLWEQLEATANQNLAILPNDPIALQYLDAARKKDKIATASAGNAGKAHTPEDLLNLSLAFYNMGMYEKCIEACEKALELKPDYAGAYNNISAAYNKLEQWEKGADAARKALKLDPNNQLAKGNLAWALSETKQ
jgi:tetratricopeptide (TPR) repeat protein